MQLVGGNACRFSRDTAKLDHHHIDTERLSLRSQAIHPDVPRHRLQRPACKRAISSEASTTSPCAVGTVRNNARATDRA